MMIEKKAPVKTRGMFLLLCLAALLAAGCSSALSSAEGAPIPETSNAPVESAGDPEFIELTQVSDLQALQALPDSTVGVTLIDFGDDAFPELERMTNLRFLAISSTTQGTETFNHVSENGLIQFLDSSKIEKLFVSDGNYGSGLLDACVNVKSLKVLHVVWALRVTDTDVSTFEEARPDVELYVELWPHMK